MESTLYCLPPFSNFVKPLPRSSLPPTPSPTALFAALFLWLAEMLVLSFDITHTNTNTQKKTHTHTQHRGANRLTHPYKYILTPPAWLDKWGMYLCLLLLMSVWFWACIGWQTCASIFSSLILLKQLQKCIVYEMPVTTADVLLHRLTVFAIFCIKRSCFVTADGISITFNSVDVYDITR